jgi:acyl carrier protein
METEEIKRKVRHVVLTSLPKDIDKKLLDHSELFSLGLDSLNILTLVLNLEEIFDVEFEMGEVSYESFRSIADITNLMKGKILQC